MGGCCCCFHCGVECFACACSEDVCLHTRLDPVLEYIKATEVSSPPVKSKLLTPVIVSSSLCQYCHRRHYPPRRSLPPHSGSSSGVGSGHLDLLLDHLCRDFLDHLCRGQQILFLGRRSRSRSCQLACRTGALRVRCL